MSLALYTPNMKRRVHQSGFSLMEVMLCLAVLAIGSIVTLTVMMGTSTQNETARGVSAGYKAAQDVAEALLSMSWSDLQNLRTYQQGPPARTLQFDVTAPGFPRLSGGSYVKGQYTLTDISDQYGWLPNTNKVYEIDIRIDHQNIHARVVTRRTAP